MNRLFLRLVCLAFLVAMALRCDSTGNPVTPDSNGISIGSIVGVVTWIDADPIDRDAISGAEVSLTGAGVTRTTTSGLNGEFMFSDLPPGAYSVSAAIAGATCNPVSVDVQAGLTGPVGIGCEHNPLGSIAGRVSVHGIFIGLGTINGGPDEAATVALSGPFGDRTTSTGHQGYFGFNNLSPGTYTLAAHDLRPATPRRSLRLWKIISARS